MRLTQKILVVALLLLLTAQLLLLAGEPGDILLQNSEELRVTAVELEPEGAFVYVSGPLADGQNLSGKITLAGPDGNPLQGEWVQANHALVFLGQVPDSGATYSIQIDSGLMGRGPPEGSLMQPLALAPFSKELCMANAVQGNLVYQRGLETRKGSAISPVTWKGQWRDRDTGLVLMGGTSWYDPALGLMLSPMGGGSAGYNPFPENPLASARGVAAPARSLDLNAPEISPEGYLCLDCFSASNAMGPIRAKQAGFDQWGEDFLEDAQDNLDWFGMIPVVGIPADAVNSIVYAARGKYALAGVSVVGIIPFGGDAASATAKVAMKTTQKAMGKEMLERGIKESVEEGVGRGAKEALAKASKFSPQAQHAKQMPLMKTDKRGVWMGARPEHNQIRYIGGKKLNDLSNLQKSELHHSLVKFLGGNNRQVLTRVPYRVHRELHKELAGALSRVGMPGVGGLKGSTLEWIRYFRAVPGSQEKALNILLDTTRAIDKKYSTNITTDLWDNLINRRFRTF